MRLRVFVAIVLSGVVMGAQSPQADFFLDILGYRMTPPSSRETVGGVPGGVVGALSPPWVSVTLVSLDRTSFQTGESFVYEVLIENTGREPIVLPWSPDLNRFPASERPSMPGFRRAALFLEAYSADRSRRLARLQSQTLLGSHAVPASLQTINPGQRALIRVPGHWRSIDLEIAAVLREPGGHVRLAAAVNLFDSIARSANDIEVVVSRRRLR